MSEELQTDHDGCPSTTAEGRLMTASATQPARKPRGRIASCRVLLVVDDACTAPELCAGVRAFSGGASLDAFVIVPAHGTASTQWYVDEDAARAEATHRLRTCISCLGRAGIRVSGELSDPDPVQGIADALHDFQADEIVLVTAPRRPSRWLRQDDIDRARRSFRQPITHLFMPSATEANR